MNATVEMKDNFQDYFLTLSKKALSYLPEGFLPTQRTRHSFRDGEILSQTEIDYSIWCHLDFCELLKEVDGEELNSILQSGLDTGFFTMPTLIDDKGEQLENVNLSDVKPQLFRELMWPLHHAVKSKKSLDVSDEELAQSLQQYIAVKEGRLSARYIMVPLYGISSLSSDIDFGEFRLVAFNDDLKTMVWDHLHGMMHAEDTIHNFNAIQYVLYKETTVNSDKASIEAITRIISAIRIALSDKIYCPYVVEIPRLSAQVGAGYNPIFEFALPHFFSHFPEAKIEEKQVNEIKKIYDGLSSEQVKDIQFALRRYNTSFSRHDIEDKIVDLTICLEVLLLHNERNELRYRLSLNLLAALGQDNNVNLTKFAKEIYDLRSAIVHNNQQFFDFYKKESAQNRLFEIVGSNKRGVFFIIETTLTRVVGEVFKIVIKHLASGKNMNDFSTKLEDRINNALSCEHNLA